MEDIKRIYANIKLPVDVYQNGEFKMLYDQMQIKMEIPNKLELASFYKIEKEIEERIQDNLLEEEEEEQEAEEQEAEEQEEDEQEEDEQEEDEQEEEEEDKKEEELEIKIYKSDYPLKKNKKRWNTTFKKNIKGNKLTKKNYLVIDEKDSEPT